MPIRAPAICQCGRAVPSGSRCLCRAQADRERKARHDQSRPSAQERGYNGKWQTARKDFLASHPTCAMCGAPSTVVDHRTPHRGDKKLFWSRSNWQPLCTSCHSSRKQSQERRA